VKICWHKKSGASQVATGTRRQQQKEKQQSERKRRPAEGEKETGQLRGTMGWGDNLKA